MANEYLKPFTPPQGLRDYTHASKTFGVSGGSYNLVPRNKFLFYVYFNLNTNIPAVANLISGGKNSTIGLMVKTAQLPSYQIDVQTMNQYNRKRLVQTKINYNPAQIVFNDDSSDLVRNMWYQYYQYYYSDPTYKYGNTPNQSGVLGKLQVPAVFGGASYTANDTYSASRGIQHWGLSGQGYSNPSLQSLATSLLTGPASGVEPFFNDITIYGMAQKSYAQYTMINPLIDAWTHDTYDYAQGNGTVVHTMSIKYEAVKYYSGDIGGAQPSEPVTGFADPSHYDTKTSPIANPGSTGIPNPAGSKQDLQALASGQNTLQNVIGAVGKGLVPTASAFAGAALAGSGAFTQGLLSGLAPALAGGSIDAARKAAGAIGGFLFPTPDYTTDSSGNTFKDGTLYRAAEVDEDISPNTPGLVGGPTEDPEQAGPPASLANPDTEAYQAAYDRGDVPQE
jgi:hypothetical protein